MFKFKFSAQANNQSFVVDQVRFSTQPNLTETLFAISVQHIDIPEFILADSRGVIIADLTTDAGMKALHNLAAA